MILKWEGTWNLQGLCGESGRKQSRKLGGVSLKHLHSKNYEKPLGGFE